MTTPTPPLNRLCRPGWAVAAVADPDDREWLRARVDGEDGTTTAQAAALITTIYTDDVTGSIAPAYDTTPAAVRRHRRRLTLKGDPCRCPRP